MSPNIEKGQFVYWKKKKSYKHGDIIAFKAATDFEGKTESVIFRVVAISGDKFEIDNGDILINDTKACFSFETKKKHIIKSKTRLNLKELGIDKEKLLPFFNIMVTDSMFTYFLNLTKSQANKINKIQGVKIEKQISSMEKEIKNISIQGDTPDFYGSILIPQKNDTVYLTEKHKRLYDRLIDTSDSLIENHIPYIVSEKLYFVIGDNMDNSLDSRYIGLISESDILGAVKIKKRNKNNSAY